MGHDKWVSRALPDYVTHYHVNGRRPFLNVSDLTDPEWEVIRQDLEAERDAGRSSRVFGRRYLELRRATEAKLRDRFVAVGGTPERPSPHYFVLGSSAWFRGLAQEMQEVVLPLASLPHDATSMTIPDSMTSMGLGGAFGLPVENRPHHGRVFRLSEISAAVQEFGLPEDEPGNYAGYQHRSFEIYAEIQVWSDAILDHPV